ncbi:hypothetical protein DOY81_005137, partial [Sarcophaga bullata]
PAPASSTSVGSGTRSPSKLSSARSSGTGGGSYLKQRKTTSSSTTAARSRTTGGAGTGGMWRFYTDDSPGIKRSCPRFGHVSIVHCLRVHVAYLGQIQPLLSDVHTDNNVSPS